MSEDIAAISEALRQARRAVGERPRGLDDPRSGGDGSRPADIHNPADAGVPPVGAGGSVDPSRVGIPPGDAEDGAVVVGHGREDGLHEDDPCGGDDVCPVLIDGRLHCVPCASFGF